MTNHADCFYAALTVLAGHGYIKQRLITAYEENLAEIDESEIPIALKQSFADLRQAMHRVSPHNGESRICASVRKMSVGEASEWAVRIAEMFAELMRSGSDPAVSLPIEDDIAPQVPPFLVKSI